MPTPIFRPARCVLLALLAACVPSAAGLSAADSLTPPAPITTAPATPAGTTGNATADSIPVTGPDISPSDAVSLDLINVQGSYVGSSGFRIKEFNGAGAAKQADYTDSSEVDEEVEYGHRFHLFGNVYFRAGFDFDRYDFSKTTAPVPLTLQKVSGEFQLEYVIQDNPGAFLIINPGLYSAGFHDLSLGNFDVPIDAGSIIPGTVLFSSLKNVFFLAGLHFSVLSKYYVTPFGGVVWLINDHCRLMGVPPEPRLVYTINKKLDLFAGGEVFGENFKAGLNPDARPQEQRFSGGVLEYSEYRVGAGLTYSPNNIVDIDFSGGWQIARDFNFYRGDNPKQFESQGAPYAKIKIEADF